MHIQQYLIISNRWTIAALLCFVLLFMAVRLNQRLETTTSGRATLFNDRTSYSFTVALLPQIGSGATRVVPKEKAEFQLHAVLHP